MKYILTESQYNRIVESKTRIETFQNLIDGEIQYIRKVCDMGAGDDDGDFGDELCDQIEEVEKVRVMGVDWVTKKQSNREQQEKYMSVKLMVYYSSIRKYVDFDGLIYNLQQMIKKHTGVPLILNYESTNTNTSFDW